MFIMKHTKGDVILVTLKYFAGRNIQDVSFISMLNFADLLQPASAGLFCDSYCSQGKL